MRKQKIFMKLIIELWRVLKMTRLEVCTSRDGNSEMKTVMFKCPICGELHEELAEAEKCLINCYTETIESIKEIVVEQDLEEYDED